MGHKVSPLAFRLPLAPTQSWLSRWFTTNPFKYREYLAADVALRQALIKKLKIAGCTRVEIERSIKNMKVIVFVTRPGIVIGRGGSGVEDLKKFILKLTNSSRIDLQIEEVKQPDLSAYLVATRVAEQLEKRLPARRVVAKTLERSMQSGAKGIKIILSGRINGAEIARRESYAAPGGSVPLQTLRADIDYAHVPALTRSGYIGVKVWIYRGEK